MFEFMKILTLRASYECLENGLLPPYLGSTIRGILGHCIREFYCHNNSEKCFLCEERENCPYVQCFSNTGGKAGAVNPYTIYVHGQEKEKWGKGEHCVFDITLFGKGTEYAGIYLDALLAAEQKGWGAGRLLFKLEQVVDPDSERLIYARGKSWIRNLSPRQFSIEERDARYAYLVFDTPLRVVSGGKLYSKLPFDMLIQFLTRRISLLTMAYTDVCLEWNLEEMLNQGAAIKTVDECWEEIPFSRYSINQKDGKLELPSKKGWILYEGDISRFVPILELGKRLRIGKSATIGFGHYEIFYDK